MNSDGAQNAPEPLLSSYSTPHKVSMHNHAHEVVCFPRSRASSWCLGYLLIYIYIFVILKGYFDQCSVLMAAIATTRKSHCLTASAASDPGRASAQGSRPPMQGGGCEKRRSLMSGALGFQFGSRVKDLARVEMLIRTCLDMLRQGLRSVHLREASSIGSYNRTILFADFL